MRETVSTNTSIECCSVAAESIWQVLRWIHSELSEREFAALLADIQPRLLSTPKLMPLELLENGSRIAAAYFLLLHGNVATLGGLRAKRECEAKAGYLVKEYQQRLVDAGIAQIQALTDVKNISTKMVMLNSPFRQVTTVRHLWIDLKNKAAVRCPDLDGYTCEPASRFPRVEFDRLVEATFVGTLDCPDLDGVRSPAEVVSGFLETKTWEAGLPWWVLCRQGQPVGCALVNVHPQQICELAYVGLIPSSRGRGLGRALVSFVVEHCRQSGGSYFTTAVDTQNWPACKIYEALKFSELRELAVWLPKISKTHHIVAA